MAIISSDRNADDEEEEEEEEGTTDYGDLCATRLEVERRGEERWVQIEIANEDSYNWGIVTRARSSSSATPFFKRPNPAMT